MAKSARTAPAGWADMVTVVAHRGDSLRYRENTLAAVASAVEVGADRVEIDVVTTRDGVSVVNHDQTLLRLWGDPRRVAEPVSYTHLDVYKRQRLDGIHKRLGGRDIVTDLHLHVAPGELVTLLGPSGCGKTTTLRMVAGFLKPDRGRVLVSGQDVTALNPEKRPSAMVFQSYALWPHMTVFKNVAFPLKLDKVPGPELTRRVEAALDMVGLMHHRDSRPARISGGEQQRVALARALVQEPKLLLLDEPLSNLDARLRVKVREEIREIQQRLGITTVLVTHDQEEALSISDRVAVCLLYTSRCV